MAVYWLLIRLPGFTFEPGGSVGFSFGCPGIRQCSITALAQRGITTIKTHCDLACNKSLRLHQSSSGGTSTCSSVSPQRELTANRRQAKIQPVEALRSSKKHDMLDTKVPPQPQNPPTATGTPSSTASPTKHRRL